LFPVYQDANCNEQYISLGSIHTTLSCIQHSLLKSIDFL
jgi:hypothetical protein